jgi:sarcosine oxidase
MADSPGGDYDAIVVGLGAMGAAATYQLARRGMRVLGIDAFELGHVNGSSHGHHRLIRRSSQSDDWQALIDRSFDLWREIEQESGETLLTITGEVSLGYQRAGREYRRFEDDPGAGGAREILDAAALAERFPGFRLYDDMLATWEAEAGFLRPERAIAAQLRLAERHGAELLRPAEVTGWSGRDGNVKVTTERGEYEAERLILTPGPWAAELLSDLDLPLRVVRIVNAYFQPERPDLWTLEHGAPDFLLSVPEGAFYGMPAMGNVGLKIGRHDNGEPTTARTIRREIDMSEVDELRKTLDRYMPGAAGPVLQTVTCMYTMTPDEAFIVERHPGHTSVIYGCGFSGTGFKYSCAIGEALADLATDAATRVNLGFLSSSRFATVEPA